MSEVTELLKNNKGLASIILVMVLGGGYNIKSESNEDAALQTLSAELHETDEIQNEKYQELLQMHNNMRIDLALVMQQLENMR